MRNSVIISVLFILSSILFMSNARAVEVINFYNPVMEVAVSDNAKTTLAKQTSTWITTNMGQKYEKDKYCSFKAATDQKYFYLTIDCEGGPVTHPLLSGRDKAYWDEDSVEVFLAAQPQKEYIHYIINFQGDIYDEKVKDATWNGNADIKVEPYAGGNRFHIAIPATELNIDKFQANTILYGNVIRNIGQNQGRRVWANLGTGFHQTKFFGEFKLTSPEKLVATDLRPAIKITMGEKVAHAPICRLKGSVYGPQKEFTDKLSVSGPNNKYINTEPINLKPSGTKEAILISRRLPVKFQLMISDRDGTVKWRSQAINIPGEPPLDILAVVGRVYPGLDGGLKVKYAKQYKNKTMALSLKSVQDNKEVFHKDYQLSKLNPNSPIIRIPMKKLPVGKYSCKVSLKGLPISQTTVFDKVDSPVSFTDYCLPIIGGKTFFPMGMMMPWPNERAGKVIPEQSAEQIYKDLDLVKEAGFNTVILACPPVYAQKAMKTIEKATQLGMYLVWSGASSQMHSRYAGKYSNMLAWYGSDEPEGRGAVAAEMIRKYNAQQDKVKYPTLVNHMWLSAFDQYCGCRDILVSDPYVVKGHESCFAKVVKYIREMRRSSGGIIPCWTILQFHRLDKFKLTVPTPEQMRCQTFLAILARVDGIFYYCTATPEQKDWHLLTDPNGLKTWKSMPKLTKEVEKYSQIFMKMPLKSSHEGDKCESLGIFWRIDKVGNKKLLTLINSNGKEVKCPLSITGADIPKKLKPYAVELITY